MSAQPIHMSKRRNIGWSVEANVGRAQDLVAVEVPADPRSPSRTLRSVRKPFVRRPRTVFQAGSVVRCPALPARAVRVPVQRAVERMRLRALPFEDVQLGVPAEGVERGRGPWQ